MRDCLSDLPLYESLRLARTVTWLKSGCRVQQPGINDTDSGQVLYESIHAQQQNQGPCGSSSGYWLMQQINDGLDMA